MDRTDKQGCPNCTGLRLRNAVLRRKILFLQEKLRKENARRMATEQQLRTLEGKSPLGQLAEVRRAERAERVALRNSRRGTGRTRSKV
jgi:hypothetical protein